MTLIEVLVATVITAMLLIGLNVVIHRMSAEIERMPWRHIDGQYTRALDLMQQDVRGLTQVVPLVDSEEEPSPKDETPRLTLGLAGEGLAGEELPGTNLPGANLPRANLPGANLPGAGVERSEHGVLLAMFRTTWRLDALARDHWAGSATVGYWRDEDPMRGGVLWRSESPAASHPGGVAWTPLLDSLGAVTCDCLIDGAWTAWPRDADAASSNLQAVRIQLTPTDASSSMGGASQITRMMPTMRDAETAASTASSGESR